MLEQGLSFILKGLLNDFIEDGDRLHEKVQIGLWSGYIVLEDLRIKSSVLSLVDVPLSLQYGYIGSLEIRIPFSRLGIEPVTVVLNKMIILLEPKYEWNEEIAAGKEQALKQAKLRAAELFATNRLEQSKKGGNSGNWFVNALLSKIIDNIQITVRDVHIRYEDTVSCPTDFCFGVSFESLHLQSRDAQSKYEESITPMKADQYSDVSRNFEKELSIGGADAFYKLAELNHMAFYWNPLQNQNLDVCSCKFSGRPDKEILTLMTKTIASRGNNILDRPRHKYILQPMDINAFFDCSMGGQKAHLRVVLAEMTILLEDRQMREIISFGLNMTNFMKLGKYSHLRPKVSVAEDKLAWFRYAAKVVLSQVNAKRKKTFTRARFNQRIEDKMVYMELWRSRLMTSPSVLQKLPGSESNLTGFGRSSLIYLQLLNSSRRRRSMASNDSELVSLSQQSLNEDSVRVLHFLERELDFQDLLYFRSLAEKNFSLEDRRATWIGSIFSWASGGKAASSEEDRRKLYDALKFEPESLYKGGSRDFDMNEVNFIANVVLKEGSVTLALSPPESSTTFQQAVPFFKLKLTELKQKVVLMGGGAHIKAFVSLQEFEAFELLPNLIKRKKAPDTVSHHIIHRRNLRSDSFDFRANSETESNLSVSEDKSVSSASKSRFGADVVPPLFSSTIEIFPPGNEIEVAVDLEVEEMEVWISPGAKWIDSIVAFSSWPEEQQYWSEMEMQAMNQLADIKARVDAKVAYMMENHSSIKIDGKIQAPVLVIHDSRYNFGSGKADVLIVDLGTIYLQTEKLAKVERQKETETKSQFQTNQSISILQHSRSPHPLEDVAEVGTSHANETDRNWQMLESEDLTEFQDAKMNDLESISKQLPFADNTFGFDNPSSKLNRRSSGLQLPNWKPSNADEKDDDSSHELFDIFQTRITKIEVYFIEVSQEDIREYGHGLWNNSTELQKTVLIPGFEIYSEIQVSVLPWDPTIPPFKVYSSISEINVQMSDSKIMRLLSFGTELAKGTAQTKKKVKSSADSKRDSSSSTASSDAHSSKRGNGIPFRFLENARKSSGFDLLSNVPLIHQVGSSDSSSVQGGGYGNSYPPRTAIRQRSYRQRRSRSFGGSTAGHSFISDHRESKSQRSLGLGGDQASLAESSRTSRSKARMRAAFAELEYQASHVESHIGDDEFDSDNDDASFFSFDNNHYPEDTEVLLEDLKYQMNQRESMRAKLIQEIRVAENDPMKTVLCEQLKADLIECEMNLHQLKISYVELLVENNESHNDSAVKEDKKEEMRDKLDLMFTPGKVDEFAEPPTTAKRDFTHARENIIPESNQMEEMSYNKELVFVQMALGVINVDFEIPKHPHNPFLRTYRFSVSGLGTKMRHKVFDTKVSMYLHEMTLSELLATPGSSSMSSVPLITSDPSIFSSYAVPINTRPIASSSSDLLRIRYGISYGDRESGDVHQAQVNMGYLGINLRWQKLTPLMEEFLRIAHLIETKSNDQGYVLSSNTVASDAGSNSASIPISPNLRRSSFPSRISEGLENGSNNDIHPISSTMSLIPKVQVAVKIECISVTLMNDTIPLVNATLTSLAIRGDTLHAQNFSVRLVDLAVYDLHSKLETRSERYSRSALYSIGSSNVTVGKNIYDNGLFLHLQSDEFSFTKDMINIDLNMKLAGIVTVSDGSLIVALCQMYTQVDKEIQSMLNMYPLKALFTSSTTAEVRNVNESESTDKSLPSFQVRTHFRSRGLKVHLPMINNDGKLTTITCDVAGVDLSVQVTNTAGENDGIPSVVADFAINNVGTSLQFKPLVHPFSVVSQLTFNQYSSPIQTPMHNFAFRHCDDSTTANSPYIELESSISKIGIDVVPELVSHLVNWQSGLQKLIGMVESTLQITRPDRKPALTLTPADNSGIAFPEVALKAQIKLQAIEIEVYKSSCDLQNYALRLMIENVQLSASLEDQILHCDAAVHGILLESGKPNACPLAKLLVSNSVIDPGETGLTLESNQWIRVQLNLSISSCDAIVDVGTMYTVITPLEMMDILDITKIYSDSIQLKTISVVGSNDKGFSELPSSSNARNGTTLRGPYAHPSSVPMRLAESARSLTSGVSDSKDVRKSNGEVHKLTIIDWRNLFRAIPLMVNVDFNFHGAQVYIPIDPEKKHMTPEILRLGVSASLQCSLPYYHDFNIETDFHDVAAVSLFRVNKHDLTMDAVLLKENPHEYSRPKNNFPSRNSQGVVNTLDDSYTNLGDGEGTSERLSTEHTSTSEFSATFAWERLLQQAMDSKSNVSTSHVLVDITVHGRTIITASSEVLTLIDQTVPYQSQDVFLEKEPDRRCVRTISEIEVTKCEVKFFADYRPFLLINEQLIDPLMKRMGQIDFSDSFLESSQSPSINSPPPKSLPSVSQDNKGSDNISINCISSVPELLGGLMDVSSVTFTVSVPAVAVSIWNDINIHPIFFGQVMISDVIISGAFQPSTDFHNARLINAACVPTENPSAGSRMDYFTASGSRHGGLNDDTIVRDLFGASNDSITPRQRGKLNFMDNLVQILQVKVDGNLSITYQNQRLLAIEPLIEPTALSVKFTQLCREDQTMAITLFLNNQYQECDKKLQVVKRYYSEDSQHHGVLQRFATDHFNYHEIVSSPIPPNLEVMIDKMNFNITTPLIQSIFTLVKSLSTVDKGYSRQSGHDKWESSMVLIRNEVGLPMQYWGTNDETHRWMLPPSEEVGWSASLLSSETHDGGPRHLNISIEKPDGTCWPEIRDISFDGSGCRIVTLGQNALSPQHRRKNAPDSSTAKGPVVILELSAKEGRKILVVRSSIRVFNATKSSMSVQFLENVPSNPSIAWELVLPPSKGAFVPINVCNVYVNGVVVTSSRNQRFTSGYADYRHPSNGDVSTFAGYIPCPEAVGMDSRDRIIRPDSNSGSESKSVQMSMQITNATQNRTKRRKKLIQQKGILNMTTYFHWINLQEGSDNNDGLLHHEEIELGVRKMHKTSFLNVMVESRDAPSKKVQHTSELSLLRTIKFIAPVSVVNLMGKNIVVALYPSSAVLQQPSASPEISAKVKAGCLELVPHMALKPGEAGESMALHASESFHLALRLNDDDHYGVSQGDQNYVWSSSTLIPGCLDHQNHPQSTSDTLSAELSFRNGSKLTILIEVVDKGGCRTINIFTPFWIIPSSFIPLQFQHDLKQVGTMEATLNGIDHLLADQAFTETNKKTSRFFPMAVSTRQRDFLSSMGRAKGMNGVILGPDFPLRGLADALRPLTKNDKTVRRIAVPNKAVNQPMIGSPNPKILQSHSQLGHIYSSQTIVANTATAGNNNLLLYQHSSDANNQQLHVPLGSKFSRNLPYLWSNQIIHCSYTNKEKMTCRLKIRNRNTLWSGMVSTESNGIRTLRLTVASNKPIDDFDGDDTMNSPFLRDGSKFLELGISVQTMEAPFQRTKSIYVVDRYSAINLVGQTIEIKQGNQEPMLTLRPNEESTVWFRPDKYVFQVRLARYGWSWSGKFSITTEGEVPVRLRNDYDNTVFFILVNVHHSGPLVKIIFKSGDKFSPYRFENHSMETFKIKQRGQSLYTNLLPYHCCAYAWDEPLALHQFSVCVQRPGQQMQDEWEEIGTFSFDRIETLQHAGQDYLALQIVTQGPTRVLQIKDIRISASPPHPLGINGQQASKLPANSGNMTMLFRDQSVAATSKKKLSESSAYSSSISSSGGSSNANASVSSAAFTLFRLSLSIHLIGLSIIDQVPQEILYVSFSDIAVEQLVAKAHHSVNMSIARFQIDNQLFNTPYPSMLHPLKEVPSSASYYQTTHGIGAAGASSATNARKNSSLVLNLQQSFDYDGVTFFPHFKVDIAPFDVNIELNVIAALINLASYAYEEYQETTVISRQQVVAMGSVMTSNQPQHQQHHQMMATASHSSEWLNTSNQTEAAQDAQSSFNTNSRATRVSVYDLYDALSSAPIAMGLAQQKLSRTQIFSIYYQLCKQQQQHQQSYSNLEKRDDEHNLTSPVDGDFDIDNNNHPQQHQLRGNHAMSQPPLSGPISLAQDNMAMHFIRKLTHQIHNIDDAIRTKPKVYFQHFEIGSFRMNVSLHPIMSTEISGFENESLLFSAVTAVVFAVASTFANIDNCPLKFPTVQVDHMFASSAGFAEVIGRKYAMEAAKQAYLLLFSSQLLGNPVQLIQMLGEGLWDFVNLPVMGLYVSPQAFVTGVLQGSLSLCRNVVASLCTTAGHLAQSLQVGLITLGAVDAYPRPLLLTNGSTGSSAGSSTAQHHKGSGHSSNAVTSSSAGGSSQSLSRATSSDNLVGMMITPNGNHRGSGHSSMTTVTSEHAQQRLILRPNGLFDAMKMSLVGAVADPWYGFQQDGIHGLVVGITKGSVGLLARPLYGTLGVTASILEALSYRLLPRFLAHQKMRLSRIRPPRFFAHANVPLQVYSAEENVGQELLARVEQGLYRNDGYLWHGIVQHVSSSSSAVSSSSYSSSSSASSSQYILLLTKQRLMLLEDFWQYTGLVWQCSLRDIVSLEIDWSDSVVVNPPSDAPASRHVGIEGALSLLNPTSNNHTGTMLMQACKLEGKPLLSVYHVPQQMKDKAPNKCSSLSSPVGARSPGFRLNHEKVRLFSHEILLTLLHRLLPLHMALASPDVLQYLEQTGVVNIATVLSMQPTSTLSSSQQPGPLLPPGNVQIGADRPGTESSSSASVITIPASVGGALSPAVSPTRTVGSPTLPANQQSQTLGGLHAPSSQPFPSDLGLYSPNPKHHFHVMNASLASGSFRSPSPILPISSAGMSLDSHHHHHHHPVHLGYKPPTSQIQTQSQTSRPVSNASLSSNVSQQSTASSSNTAATTTAAATAAVPAAVAASVISLHAVSQQQQQQQPQQRLTSPPLPAASIIAPPSQTIQRQHRASIAPSTTAAVGAESDADGHAAV